MHPEYRRASPITVPLQRSISFVGTSENGDGGRIEHREYRFHRVEPATNCRQLDFVGIRRKVEIRPVGAEETATKPFARWGPMTFFASISNAYLPITWALLALIGAVGLVALASPQWFARLDAFGSRWIDTSGWIAKLDRRIDVDGRVLPHSRLLGGAVLASVALVAWMISGQS